MNNLSTTFTSSKIMYGGLGFVLALVSGIILSRSGRPLNSALFTIHKLVAVGTVILLGIGIRDLYKIVDVQALYPVIIVITGLFFLALVVSGALLSFDKMAVRPILMVHQIAPLLSLALATITVYLLVGNKS
jgi:hypothetical protein